VDDLRAGGLDGAGLEGRIAVLWSGWTDQTWNTPRLYADNPFLDPAAAEWLAERRIAALGLDFAVDPGPPYPCHLALLGAGIPLIENLVHLDQIGQREFVMIALPHKVVGGNGGQARVVALV
jgi:kynurenine formamidase